MKCIGCGSECSKPYCPACYPKSRNWEKCSNLCGRRCPLKFCKPCYTKHQSLCAGCNLPKLGWGQGRFCTECEASFSPCLICGKKCNLSWCDPCFKDNSRPCKLCRKGTMYDLCGKCYKDEFPPWVCSNCHKISGGPEHLRCKDCTKKHFFADVAPTTTGAIEKKRSGAICAVDGCDANVPGNFNNERCQSCLDRGWQAPLAEKFIFATVEFPTIHLRKVTGAVLAKTQTFEAKQSGLHTTSLSFGVRSSAHRSLLAEISGILSQELANFSVTH